MPQRIAASLALTAFAMCVLMGISAGNTFSTVLVRALFALAATFALGLVIGHAGQKMIDENLRAEEAKLRNVKVEADGKADN